jgi:hypothetical protein
MTLSTCDLTPRALTPVREFVVTGGGERRVGSLPALCRGAPGPPGPPGMDGIALPALLRWRQRSPGGRTARSVATPRRHRPRLERGRGFWRVCRCPLAAERATTSAAPEPNPNRVAATHGAARNLSRTHHPGVTSRASVTTVLSAVNAPVAAIWVVTPIVSATSRDRPRA